MITIEVKDKGRWVKVPNGPFPITEDELAEARLRFAEAYEKSSPLSRASASTARDILSQVAPKLSDFDRICVAYAVTNKKVRVVPTL